MALVEVKNVSFSYPNGFCAVDDISFTVEPGENIAIIGQNGAGKTTTVKMLNGLMKPTKGDIIVEGKNTKDHTTAQIARTVGYVFQNPDDQIFNNSVYKEMEYALKRMKLSSEEIQERIENAAKMCELTEYLEMNPYDLPLSLRKFVTIASVIAMDCQVMIFDEPTAGQDLKGLECLSNIIKQLLAQGKAVITITHDMEFVAENYDRVIVMCQKKIIADGKTNELFFQEETMKKAMLKQPALVRIATQLGLKKMNLDMKELAQNIKSQMN